MKFISFDRTLTLYRNFIFLSNYTSVDDDINQDKHHKNLLGCPEI